jgi:hypothetical protein
MSAGIFLLLFAADSVLARYDEDRRRRKQREEHEQQD